MIKTFSTTSAPSTGGGTTPSGTPSGTSSGTSSGGMNKIILAVVVLGAIYVGYRFVIKPMMDAKKANQDAE